MMPKDKENSKNKNVVRRISRRKMSSSQQSVKRRILSWLQDNLWLNKKNNNVRKRKSKLKWKSKGFNKLKKSP